MARFASDGRTLPAAARGSGPVQAAQTPGVWPPQPAVRTATGGAGSLRDARSELFLLAVTNMVGFDQFHEKGTDRDARFVSLVHEVTATDPAWMGGFLPWLRRSGFMRTAAVIGAAEYVKAGGPGGRQLIAATLARADEPAELMAYWLSRYGRPIPKPVKRGLADACRALYREDTPLRYDSAGHTVRPGDVIEMCRPRPGDAAQAALFRHLIDRRHGRDDATNPGVLAEHGLTDLAAVYLAEAVPAAERRVYLTRGLPRLMGWERVGGWLPGGMDAQAWEQLAPQIGYMALVRNLRNIEKAGVSRATQDLVRARLVDPDAVAKSRMLPFRFWQAYQATDRSLLWGRELEDALNLSCRNIPKFTGRTLVMVDCSGSMWASMGRGTMARYQAAGLFAAAIALRNPGRTDVYAYGSRLVPVERVASVVQTIDKLHNLGSTLTWQSTAEAYRRGGHYDRIVIVTDEQSHDQEQAGVFGTTPIYVWNVAGYQVGTIRPGSGRTVLGGLSDASFNVVPLIERGQAAGWPWEIGATVVAADDPDA